MSEASRGFATAVRWALAVAITCLLQGCAAFSIVVLAPMMALDAIQRDPAPTADLPESTELLNEVAGTVVVADRERYLSVVELPGGKLTQISTRWKAIAASEIDARGRIVYLRASLPWTLFAFGRGEERVWLVTLDAASGGERTLCELDAGETRFAWISNAGGMVLVDHGSRLRLFEIETGDEIDVSWWDDALTPIGLTPDGLGILAWRIPIGPDGLAMHRVQVRVDRSTRVCTDLPPGPASRLDLGGERVELDRNHSTSTGMQRHFPGLTLYDPIFLDDRHAIYEGLASPASRPGTWFGFTWPNFERSIRLCDVETSRTVTLVPRFGLGTFAFSPHRLPAGHGAR